MTRFGKLLLPGIVAMCLLTTASWGGEASSDDWIRLQAARLPLLETGSESGSPKFTVVRLNAVPLLTQGYRFGGVRIVCPAGRKSDLVWMFSDVTNIDEYRIIPLKPGKALDTNLRMIYEPTASLEHDDDSAHGLLASSLPRPWDLFQLHMLGVPAAQLNPGAEYLIWFRFSDRRPTDVLLAASFIAPLPKLDPASLPSVMALPPQSVSPE